jgi:hypothetical protein
VPALGPAGYQHMTEQLDGHDVGPRLGGERPAGTAVPSARPTRRI